MGLQKESLIYFENKHNEKFPDSIIKITKRVDKYVYFDTEFGECKMYIGNIGRANYSMRAATNKTEYLVNRLYKLHGDKYDYSLVKYEGKTSDKVTLICSKHGNFDKVINTLITNKNVYCPKCYNESIRGLNRVSKKSYFIDNANKIHNFKYDYSISKYITAKKEIEIICPLHGIFKQLPHVHLSGGGCNTCNKINISIRMQEYPTGWTATSWIKAANRSKNFDSFKVYIIKCWNNEEEFYKIGRTFLKVNKRFRCKTTMPYKFEIIDIIEGSARMIYNLENQLKKVNKNNKYIPKITFEGMYECFTKIKLE